MHHFQVPSPCLHLFPGSVHLPPPSLPNPPPPPPSWQASALALRKVPAVNSSWHGDFIRQYNVVDCSIAVQTPIGLMVPIVRDADAKGLAQIAAEVKELAGKVGGVGWLGG